MLNLLIAVVCMIFATLSALHAYWAFDGQTGSAAAIPSTGGVAAFKPSRGMTLLVALLLLLAGLSVLISGRVEIAGVPAWISSVPAMTVALILAARAVGDFRLVGFFKKPNDSRFAFLDTRYYSPLCLGLAIAIAIIVAAV